MHGRRSEFDGRELRPAGDNDLRDGWCTLSIDAGANWSAVNSGLTTLSIRALAIDPQNTGKLYAGTAGGVFAITFVSEEH